MKHHGILVSVLLFSATGIFAQEDVRVASTVTELEGGLFEIVIVNEASEAMTAFMVVVEGLGSSPGRNPIGVHYRDSVRYSHKGPAHLAGWFMETDDGGHSAEDGSQPQGGDIRERIVIWRSSLGGEDPRHEAFVHGGDRDGVAAPARRA